VASALAVGLSGGGGRLATDNFLSEGYAGGLTGSRRRFALPGL